MVWFGEGCSMTKIWEYIYYHRFRHHKNHPCHMGLDEGQKIFKRYWKYIMGGYRFRAEEPLDEAQDCLDPENYLPNQLIIYLDGRWCSFPSVLMSCPCEKCNHTTQHECYIGQYLYFDEKCECCSNTCT